MLHKKFSLSGHSLHVLAVAVVALMAGTACQSTKPATTTAAVSVPTALEVNVEDPDNPDAPQVRPTYRDGYPNFGGSLTAANVQMSNQEATALQAQLSALGAARTAGTITEAAYQAKLAELRALASQHGPETQAQIAN